MAEKTIPNKLNGKKSDFSEDTYRKLYQESIDSPQNFWVERAQEFISFFEPWETVTSGTLTAGNMKWFEGAKLNACYNCVDRHLEKNADKTAIIWQGDEPSRLKRYNYHELHEHVCRFANLLKAHGIKKGDRVCLYLPMIPEAAFAMLACARIGAIHSVVFAGFSASALKDRIQEAECKLVITADISIRGGQIIPLKPEVDAAVSECPSVKNVLVIRQGKESIDMLAHDIDYADAIKSQSTECPVEIMEAEDPLFILYTSGSTGKPKGVLHTTAGYLLYAAMTHRYVFNCQEDDIYWCAADIGWITGHSYIVYGPFVNAATTLIYEGTPTYPNSSRFWSIIDKHHVNIFYTAPTVIRMLMGQGDTYLKTSSRKSLRILGSVGEPLNPEAWKWYYSAVGKNHSLVIDTWWQTETGGIMITALPGAYPLKPGAATKPFFGIQTALLDDEGNELQGPGVGKLVIKAPWPGMMRGVYNNDKCFHDTYLSPYPGYYYTGDGASRDADGDYWITGRVDDVINVSGHRLGTAEIESALVAHEAVAEAGVVGFTHDIKGQGVYAFVSLIEGVKGSEALETALQTQLREAIGPIAKVDQFQWTKALPKTRSGKIMRRLLRKIANDDTENLGDMSTLADETVIEKLIEGNRAHTTG